MKKVRGVGGKKSKQIPNLKEGRVIVMSVWSGSNVEAGGLLIGQLL